MSRFDRTAMKHARLYTALPRVGRVRSNSASSRTLYTNPTTLQFFDPAPPPPPNTRLTAHRLPIEARGEVEGPNSGGNPHTTHAPLALAAPHAPANQHPHPAQLALLFPYTPGPAPKPGPAHAASGTRTQRRRGPRYTLDVGAYGIPKRGHRVRALHTHAEVQTDAPLAVQVGEDAYFVRENAMGVADGVGGWARVKHSAPPTGPSASALFARRLMHFCADEVDRASHPHPQAYLDHPPHPTSTQAQPIVTPWRAPYPASSSSLPSTSSSSLPPPRVHAWEWKYDHDRDGDGTNVWDLYPNEYPPPGHDKRERIMTDLEVEFPHLFEGEQEAWDRGVAGQDKRTREWKEEREQRERERAREEREREEALEVELGELAEGLDVLHILERAYERTLSAHVVPAPSTTRTTPASPPSLRPFTPEPQQQPKTIPLLAGSSTALVAVLDYVPAGEVAGFEFSGASSAAGIAAANLQPANLSTNTAAAKDGGGGEGAELTPVLKIAHVGDCMGMLVRGGEVAWRSEEMWWRWNTPVQLSAVDGSGAASGSTTSAAKGKGKAGEVEKEKGARWRPASATPSIPTSTPTTQGKSSANTNAPSTSTHVTPSSAAHLFTLPVQAGDIVILASDGLSDNLWDEDVLEEVERVGRAWSASSSTSPSTSGSPTSASASSSAAEAELFELDADEELKDAAGSESPSPSPSVTAAVDSARLRRRTLAGMLSEALCSRARRVATRRAGKERGRACVVPGSPSSAASSGAASSLGSTSAASSLGSTSLPGVREEAVDAEVGVDEDDTPFARRARETGRVYRGGKNDDISVIVAVIAPAEEQRGSGRGSGGGRVEAARAAGS
ncbi:hypothetical protein DFH06DRAFT_1471007 [Mycena polygramma]|nr:hypothetical protein DFH06DRAFT_1471007 [Mycena polygramma]